MKGVKASVDEGGSRVPCFIQWPGKIKAGTIVKQLAASIDIFPTLMDLSGLPIPTTFPLDGKSLMPLIKNPDADWLTRNIYTHVYKGSSLKAEPGAVRNNEYRLVISKGQNQLYNMLNDAGQKKDISAQNPAVVKELRRQYDNWFTDVTRQGIRPEITKIGYSQAPQVELFAPDAVKEGKVSYFATHGYAHDWFTGWQDPQDVVYWNIEAIEAGEYEIKLRYNAPKNFVGSTMQVSLNGKTVEKPVEKAFYASFYPSPDRVEHTEAFEKDWATLSMGKIYIPKGQHRLYGAERKPERLPPPLN